MKIVLVLLSLVTSVYASAAVREGRDIKSTSLVALYDKLVAVDARLVGGEIDYANRCGGEFIMKLRFGTVQDFRNAERMFFQNTTPVALKETENFVLKTFKVLNYLQGRDALQKVTGFLEYAIANEANPNGFFTYDVLRASPDYLLNWVVDVDKNLQGVLIIDPTTREVMAISTRSTGTHDCD